MGFANGLNDSQEERLDLLIEEAAEVIQMACKIQRFGYDSSHPNYKDIPNKQLLTKELGDLLFAIDLLVENFDLDYDELIKAQCDKNDRVWEFFKCYHLKPQY